MATESSCSWCHTPNPADRRHCRRCGHLAHVPRAACTCDLCSGMLAAESLGACEPRRREPSYGRLVNKLVRPYAWELEVRLLSGATATLIRVARTERHAIRLALRRSGVEQVLGAKPLNEAEYRASCGYRRPRL